MSHLGIDIGSLYLSSALIEKNKLITATYYEHKGNIINSIKKTLNNYKSLPYNTIGITGNLLGSTGIQNKAIIDNVLCVIEGARFLEPASLNVISIGGQNFFIAFFDESGHYREHTVNPPCASGTGSFIEQQAENMNISVNELADRAYQYRGKTPRIATRCAVFAKSDIIHSFQEGYSLDAICAGLCEGIARSILDGLVRGRKLTSPLAIVGGVSLNKKVIETIRIMLNIKTVVPAPSYAAGAIGAALLGKEKKPDIKILEKEAMIKRDTRIPLKIKSGQYPDFKQYKQFIDNDIEILVAQNRPLSQNGLFMGVDIGSTSTKAVLINGQKEFIGGFYTKTGGKPINAVKSILKSIRNQFPGQLQDIKAVCTTGSGRKMIKELFNADLVINEITAHALAATHLYPQVDTIIEIGGQDSKFTLLKQGEVYFSNMNYVCAAGTGSFIEEQAKRLGLSLKSFSDKALGVKAPYTSDRCTVYMERDLNVLINKGWSKNALAAAVLFSVRDNYLAKVVNKSPLGNFIVFQGATARNQALVAAFQKYIKKPIYVSPFCHLTGALGAALFCKKERIKKSNFLLNEIDFTQEQEVCKICTNNCVLTIIKTPSRTSAWGMKCGREYAEKKKKGQDDKTGIEIRLQEAMAPLFKIAKKQSRKLCIGLAPALYNIRYNPLWYNFLKRLGYKVVASRSLSETLDYGKNIINSDFCAPLIMAHGHMKQLLDMQVDLIFAPALVNENDPHGQDNVLFRKKTKDSYFCYYSQYLATIVSNLTAIDIKDKLISPLLSFNYDNLEQISQKIYNSLKQKIPYLSKERVTQAFGSAYKLFRTQEQKWQQLKHQENSGKIKVVLLGRPYVIFDPVINLNIPKKLENMGIELYWQEEFDCSNIEAYYANKYLERMHWHYGRQIIKLAEYIARKEELFAIYLSCFRCSPDSFLLSYFKDIMTYYKKPFLILQLDEHASDVGYTTRIEAGVRSFNNYLQKSKVKQRPKLAKSKARDDRLVSGDTVLIPYINKLISRFWADCFIKQGHKTLVLDTTEKAINRGYQYASGGECMPTVAIAGGVLEKIDEKGLDPKKTFLYLPTLCISCNFPQFTILTDMIMQNAGQVGLKIALINSMAPADVLPGYLAMKIFESSVIASLLYKYYFRIKPYEVNKGETDKTLTKAQKIISKTILEGGNLKTAFKEICTLFNSITRNEKKGRKPRIGILGDLYLKYNEVVNQNIQKLILDLGMELIIPSFSELAFHFFDTDIRVYKADPRPLKMLKLFERRYEIMARDLLSDQFEPDWHDCYTLLQDYGLKHYIPGETPINVGRALYYARNKKVEAIVHTNPIFCCPGVVSSSIYRKIQRDYNMPIIDIFYDGTGDPNRVLIPHIHYLGNT